MNSDTYRVDGIPALVVHPRPEHSNRRLAVWMHWLGGNKEGVRPALDALADHGYTAISLDADQHGERAELPQDQLMAEGFGDFRRVVWPILGRTVLDAMTVADHALRTFDLDQDYVAGGVSLGGDLAIALAGADPRVGRVAAVVATPDWSRPGMARLDDPDTELEQGEPDSTGTWLRSRLDPALHPDAYRGRVRITFEMGGADRHIPLDNAKSFRTALTAADSSAAERIRINVHPGLDHLAAARDEDVITAAISALDN